MTDHNLNSMSDPGDREHLLTPAWVSRLEARLAAKVPLPPALISAAKLVLIVPLLKICVGAPTPHISARPWLLIILFLLYLAADYLADIVAQQRQLEPAFGRIFDRASDYPLIFMLAWLTLDTAPAYLGVFKALIDLTLLLLYLLGKGTPKNRLHQGVNYAVLLALLSLYEGWGTKIITPELTGYLLLINILFSAAVALYNLNILQKRFIADLLSAGNLLCGVFSMAFAYRGRIDLSLLFLMLGAAFDGFDGAAARKWGGTSWGVYSDDVADAVNYGIAPGVALWFALGGGQGLILGAFYTVFTLSRLVFFTLNKSSSDPDYFSGVPSTLGGLITLSSLILFQNQTALIGLMVGVAGILMVSFDTQYRHLGRALAKHRRAFFGLPFLLIILLGGIKLIGREAPAVIVLVAALAYALRPTVMHMVRVIGQKGEAGD
jgi:CDP-diacylglycerol---serine O-phosphatidyltransferase